MRITFAYPHGRHRPGDTVEVDDLTGRTLVRDGIARRAPAPATKAPSEVPTDLVSLTAAELRQRCADAGLPKSGTKQQLAERLATHHTQEVTADER